MIRLILIALLLPLCATAQQPGPPHPLDGVWQTGARNGSWGIVRFAPCGAAYCGTLTGGGGANVDPQYFGTVLVRDMVWDGSAFTGGTLEDVENGAIYRARLRFRGPDRLRVSGCILGGVICGGQTWTRLE